MPLAWATHRLGGVQSPANAQYSVQEVAYQLKDSKAKCLFTCLPLLESAIKAAQEVGMPKNRIYILDMADQATGGAKNPGFKTVNQLIEEGSKQPPLDKLNWSKGDGARKTAFLCYSSGTSGLPKGVMISHLNVIANTLQIYTFDKVFRDTLVRKGEKAYTENTLGLLPFSHIYALGEPLRAE